SFRAQSQFPERRNFTQAQSRVHHAGGVLGLCRFREDCGLGRGNDLSCGRGDYRDGGWSSCDARAGSPAAAGELQFTPPVSASGCGGKRDADDQSNAAVAAGALSRVGAGSGGRGLVSNLKRATAGAGERPGRGNSPTAGRFRSNATRFRKTGGRENFRSAFRHTLSQGIGSVGETESSATGGG